MSEENNNEGTEGEENAPEELTPEQVAELREENEALKAQVARSRTAKARETRAAKRAANKPAPSDDDDETAAIARERDEERAKREALEVRYQRSQARSIASELGAVDPSDIVKLLDWEEILDPDDEDEVKQAIKVMLREKPHLKKAPPKADGGEGGVGNSGSDMNSIIRRAAGRGR